jgi:hypothetical protein
MIGGLILAILVLDRLAMVFAHVILRSLGEIGFFVLRSG